MDQQNNILNYVMENKNSNAYIGIITKQNLLNFISINSGAKEPEVRIGIQYHNDKSIDYLSIKEEGIKDGNAYEDKWIIRKIDGEWRIEKDSN